MPDLMNEYILKRLSVPDLEAELLKLISSYNKQRSSYLFVYSAAIGKPIPEVPLNQADYFIIHDMLKDKKSSKRVDMYLETPGGSGETAEEIVRFLHDNFQTVSFVVSGEAKSAGTIMVMSGDEILMTETGSLGPIDAQMKIGRSIVSAYDYMEWVDEKRKEADTVGKLNPFDATMVAQITPGELGSVFHSLKFAEDLVVEWLVKYKFKNWTVTETQQNPVTEEMKKERAESIASQLTKHSKWRSHGRSIKIRDLEDIGVKITRVDADLKLSETVYRIQTVCRLLFNSSNIFKIFATQDSKIFRTAMPSATPINLPIKPVKKAADVIEVGTNCPQCGIKHSIYAKFVNNPQIDKDFQAKGSKPFPADDKLICSCGFTIDLGGLKKQIEINIGKKIL
jgi:hypothetical protein